ncbi:Txe/YoeB family addiction module toxin [uncultured Brachyspira sp.]|uniref:Txe/YoeB family addiction module toxin n=1 Tax=uncultured Brachyspira sp. TaxID=221953 RepID=UPI0026260105|nr:Txe/YoeB family addiction module toxin [uncultured Brachyspira sp.]
MNDDIIVTKKAKEHILFFQKTDKKILKRINDLIESILKTPYKSIGKPEKLKHKYEDCYSRRINKKT